jgi:hypothetical protein
MGQNIQGVQAFAVIKMTFSAASKEQYKRGEI